jgi:hypothetical protein
MEEEPTDEEIVFLTGEHKREKLDPADEAVRRSA